MADDAVDSMGDLGTENGTRGLLYDIADMKTINTQDLADRIPEEGRQEFLDTMKPHHHDRNQMTYVLKGSLRYGRQEAKPGMGYFTPKKRYTWTSGPEGAEFLEITDGPPAIPITD